MCLLSGYPLNFPGMDLDSGQMKLRQRRFGENGMSGLDPAMGLI